MSDRHVDTRPQLTQERPADRTGDVPRRHDGGLLRLPLWLGLVLSLVANGVGSGIGLPLPVTIGFGVLALACAAALTVQHRRYRRHRR